MSSQPILPISVPEALTWLADLFAEQESHVNENTPRRDVPGWDSMGQLMLMAGLDERFGIQLSNEELTKLRSISDVLDILRRHACISS